MKIIKPNRLSPSGGPGAIEASPLAHGDSDLGEALVHFRYRLNYSDELDIDLSVNPISDNGVIYHLVPFLAQRPGTKPGLISYGSEFKGGMGTRFQARSPPPCVPGTARRCVNK